MKLRETRSPKQVSSRRWQAVVAALLAGVLLAGPALAGSPPPPPPSSQHRYPPPDYYPGPPPVGYVPVRGAPPPLPVAMRVIYAPFYVAGLVIRYGVYYVLVAPFEVLFRTIDYGAEGGVGRAPGSRQ
jgi:hypothetical protein